MYPSRQAHQSWYPLRLVSLTLYVSNFPDLYALIIMQPEFVLKIKSLEFDFPLHLYVRHRKRPANEFKRSSWLNHDALNAAEKKAYGRLTVSQVQSHIFGK